MFTNQVQIKNVIEEFKDGVIRLFLAACGMEVGISGFSYGAKFHDPALYFAGGVGFLAFAGLVALTVINAVIVLRGVKS